MEYQKVLLKRLLEMIEDNEKEKIYFESAKKKLPSMFFTFDAEYQEAWNSLSKNEQRAYWNKGMKHSKASLKRVRIELNKAMIEKEKNEIYGEYSASITTNFIDNQINELKGKVEDDTNKQ